MKAMVSQGALHENELITDGKQSICMHIFFIQPLEMSDDAVKKLRDDLTKKAILYLEQVLYISFSINLIALSGKGKNAKE